MEHGPTFYAVAVVAVLISAVSKGGFGSGAGFVSAPLLALVMPPAQAVGLLLPLLMLMDVTSLKSYWRKWDWPHARLLMIGGVPGTLLGWWLFRSISADGVRLMVGAMALGFVLFQIARQRRWLRPPPGDRGTPAGLFWGTITGFTSFVSHAGGPPATMYLLGAGLDKTTYQATTVIVFWFINAIKLPFYLALGMFTAESALVNFILGPIAVAGVFIGVWAHDLVEEKLFFRLTYALLAVAGGKLIYDALT
ncbi:sulfite exporter TauE/SafE family protein [uncultured Amaricoccus sp.]|uniref:sulfite exporter TauE/SafE family protein n=1 Tax=uncultured Amaricoccus sp. TaxID=339341 RepID=UPI00262ADF02|nr:sulfite exporter TauE/SafE family protein [uncultured Amaricoccus sp.]